MDNNKNLIKLWANNEKRQTFLSDYKSWGVWFTTPELELMYYRYLLPDGTTIIATEYRRELTQYSKEEIGVLYYTQGEGTFVCPKYASSIGYVAELLKAAKVKLQQDAKKSEV